VSRSVIDPQARQSRGCQKTSWALSTLPYPFNVLKAARFYFARGPIPILLIPEGKQPLVRWGELVKRPPSREEVEELFKRALEKHGEVNIRLADPELVPRTRPQLLPGVDLKAEGSYVVAPPSLHLGGRQHEFVGFPGEIAEHRRMGGVQGRAGLGGGAP